MDKKGLARFVLLFSLFFTAFALQQIIIDNQSVSIKIENNQNLDYFLPEATYKEENLTLKFEFIGFNQSLIDESAIESELYNDFRHSVDLPLSELHFNFEFNYVLEDDREDLEEYIISIADSGVDTGYELNLTLLQEDLISGERSNIFIPRDGMSIDAELVNEYLFDNLYQEPINDPGYTFFLMNFSNLDSLDHTFEHWYDVNGTGLDSNESITWWYSGYSNLEKRAATGWGGKYRFCYLDVSARSWYLDFVKTAWISMGGEGYQLYYDYPDLDNLTQTYDPNTTEGNEILNQYLAEWINTYLGNVLSGPVYSDLPIGDTISLQVLVLNNLTDNGYPIEDLDWCISQNRIFNQLAVDFPWIDWQIEIEWVELSDYPIFYDYIHDNVLEDINGKYIAVQNGLYQLLEDELENNFDLNAADVVLPCYFFLTDDIGFRWFGVSFAGLGGMGWEILLATQYSLFEDGIIGQPRRGYSNVMIHELGHSLGLPHPHSATFGWGSSFISDIMSYFAYDDCFSTFYQDAIGRSHTDVNYAYALDEYVIALDVYNDSGKPIELLDTMFQINNTLELIPQYYQQMDYNSSATYSFLLRDLLEYVINYLEPTSTPTPTTTSTSNQFGFLAVLVILPSIYFIVRLKKKTK